MVQAWMITGPRSKSIEVEEIGGWQIEVDRKISKKAIGIMLSRNDCKKWTIGQEKGKNGYKHWQIRVESSNTDFFEWCKKYIPSAHVEKSRERSG